MMEMVIYQLKGKCHNKEISIDVPFIISRFIVICLTLLSNVQHWEFSESMI